MEQCVVGIDEAGRGPLAGPVVAAAFVVLDAKYRVQGAKLRDSKLLSAKQRELIYTELNGNSKVEWGIGQTSEKYIDKINILQATRLAMRKAFLSLSRKLSKRGISPTVVIVDGTTLLEIPIPHHAVPHADSTVLSCMAASIIAKVTRDRLMLKYHTHYPQYGFDRHKGYGTAYHFKMLKKYGPSPVHRLSFRPLAKLSDA